MILEEVESVLCMGALYLADFVCESVAIVTVAHAALKASASSATYLDVARFTLQGASFALLWASPLICLVTLIAIDTLFGQRLDKVLSLPQETYERLHELAGMAIVSATWRSSLLGESYFKAFHDKVLSEGEIHGAPVEFADIPLDALVVRNNSDSNRWLLVAGGSAEIYQRRLLSPGSNAWKKEKAHHWQLADQLGANILFFNYPGVGLSKGAASRRAMIETHKMVQKYLERREGAEQIVCLGFSLSGGVQAEAISEYSGQEGVEYVLVKDRTFSELRLAVEDRVGQLASWALSLLGWDVNASKECTLPQIILQRGSGGAAQSDGMISASAALASHAGADHEIIWLEHGDHDSQLEPGLINNLAKRVDSQFQVAAAA